MQEEIECFPLALIASDLEPQTYTMTDTALAYTFPPFEAFPPECEVRYQLDMFTPEFITLEGNTIIVDSEGSFE